MRSEDELRLSFYKELTPIRNNSNVILVENLNDHRLYVKKRLSVFDEDILSFFERERFPHIPKVIETIRDGDEIIQIEEHINGRTLAEILEDNTLQEDEVRDYTIQLCSILAPLHGHKPPIVHRDIKPDNIIIRDGELFLIDFNIAKEVDPNKSRDTELMGTAEYAAPEQYGFAQSTPRTDIYSIGVLMNKMLTGRLPSEIKYEGSLARVISKCMAIDPGNRYSSVGQIAEALGNRDQTYRLPGFRRGNKAFAALAVIWYTFCILMTATIEPADENGVPITGVMLFINRMAFFVMVLAATMYATNYLGARDLFPFKKQNNKIIELLRLVLGGVIVVFTPILVLVMIEAILK